MLAAFQAREDGELPGIGVEILSLPANASETAFERAFRNRADVEFAEVDRPCPRMRTAQRPALSQPYGHLPRIAAPGAWSVTSGSSGIIIAILDTAVDAGPSRTWPAKTVPGLTLIYDSADTRDVYGHGTKVAGTEAPDGYASYSDIAPRLRLGGGLRCAGGQHQLHGHDEFHRHVGREVFL